MSHTEGSGNNFLLLWVPSIVSPSFLHSSLNLSRISPFFYLCVSVIRLFHCILISQSRVLSFFPRIFSLTSFLHLFSLSSILSLFHLSFPSFIFLYSNLSTHFLSPSSPCFLYFITVSSFIPFFHLSLLESFHSLPSSNLCSSCFPLRLV